MASPFNYFLPVVASLLFGLAGTSAIEAHAGEKVQLLLKQEATVTGRHFSFADIAVVQSSDPALKRQIEQLRLGGVPRVGQAERYSREELSRVLHTRWLSAPLSIEWDGAKAVQVRTASQLIDTADLVAAAATYLTHALSQNYEHVTVSPLTYPPDTEIPVGKVTYRLHPTESGRFALRIAVRTDVCVDNVAYRTVTLAFAVEATKKALVAMHDLTEGEVATAQDFQLISMDAARFIGETLDPKEMPAEVRTKRPVHAGEILVKKSIRTNTAVTKGEAVKLIVAEGSVAIEVAAVAQQDGDVGQTVAVKPSTSESVIQASVVSGGVVRAVGG